MSSIMFLLVMLPVIFLGIFLVGISIYVLMLLIQLMKRGIIALDIYIDKNK